MFVDCSDPPYAYFLILVTTTTTLHLVELLHLSLLPFFPFHL